MGAGNEDMKIENKNNKKREQIYLCNSRHIFYSLILSLVAGFLRQLQITKPHLVKNTLDFYLTIS